MSNLSTAQSDVRLLVLDIDGTIAGESNEIREPVKQAIQAVRDRGVQVAIATGRMYCSALRFHQELGLTLPLISYQGALIKDPQTNQVHHHLTLDAERVLELLDHLEQAHLRNDVSIHLYIEDQLYVRELSGETVAYAERSGIEPQVVGDLRQVAERPPTKLLALSDRVDLINSIFTSLWQRYTPAELYLTKSVSTFFEAANAAANKGNAVRYLAESLLGLRAEQVMAIGDNFNDVEMLKYAGIGVAMGNGPTQVQELAQWVAPDVEEDGVAEAIVKFLL